jgi:transcription termination factor NusB
MNDSKWEKLIDGVTGELDKEIFLNYKLIHNNEVFQTSFLNADLKPFFIEPTLYKEVEWVEFICEYKNYISENNKKAGKKLFTQDIEKIASTILKLGHFEIMKTEKTLKVYGYK